MEIGKMLRKLRRNKNMTLDELSRKSKVALATLSRIETGKMTGTIDAHKNICKALGTSLADLYNIIEQREKTIDNVPSGKAEYYPAMQDSCFELLVTKTHNKMMLPLMIKLAKNASSSCEYHDPGIEKFVYVITGTLSVKLNDDIYKLKPGDSLYFDGSLKHSFFNSGKIQVKAIMTISNEK